MTYLAKPQFHHPALPKNELGYTHRDYEGSISTLCAGCGQIFDFRHPDRGLLRTVDRTAPRGETLRHRMLVEDTNIFSRQLPRI